MVCAGLFASFDQENQSSGRVLGNKYTVTRSWISQRSGACFHLGQHLCRVGILPLLTKASQICTGFRLFFLCANKRAKAWGLYLEIRELGVWLSISMLSIEIEVDDVKW